jgi:hypothetical protein
MRCFVSDAIFRHDSGMEFIKMISIMLKINQSEQFNYDVEFCPEFDTLNKQQQLDLLQDAVFELNKKWKAIDENY